MRTIALELTEQYQVKLKISILCSPIKGLKHAHKGCIYKNVLGGTDYNSKKLETNSLSINRKVDKLCHIHTVQYCVSVKTPEPELHLSSYGY